MTTINERDWNKLWEFRKACRAPGTVAGTASSGARMTQVASPTPAADDSLRRAVERLCAAGQATAEAPENSPLAKAIQRLVAAAPTKAPQ